LSHRPEEVLNLMAALCHSEEVLSHRPEEVLNLMAGVCHSVEEV
jgi:hypothetical protein